LARHLFSIENISKRRSKIYLLIDTTRRKIHYISTA
jgi:hypothetical protein